MSFFRLTLLFLTMLVGLFSRELSSHAIQNMHFWFFARYDWNLLVTYQTTDVLNSWAQHYILCGHASSYCPLYTKIKVKWGEKTAIELANFWQRFNRFDTGVSHTLSQLDRFTGKLLQIEFIVIFYTGYCTIARIAVAHLCWVFSPVLYLVLIRQCNWLFLWNT